MMDWNGHELNISDAENWQKMSVPAMILAKSRP